MSKKYIYQADKGIIQIASHKIKKSVAALAVTFGAAAIMAVPAFAASNSYCGSSANGCDQSGAQTSGDCAGHGAFGAFGKDNSWAGGASGDHTAYNNSTLCGHPSDNSSAGTIGDVPTNTN